ncbi:Retrovirus-related Pol polyprotein from transposon TNT 1-94 [Sarcoptes scabiei]|uniref:Retrovirus-related Pol polyprotein from transposon TNT 1-94 n=1 Tax=Sarcoptes scabiei TaxID=52283 RepID=A0A834VF17_SARSC|nr:Retrovirus-related Pol polyprotein from transposon TNT 1-94 [Sarcoptes scabiei]
MAQQQGISIPTLGSSTFDQWEPTESELKDIARVCCTIRLSLNSEDGYSVLNIKNPIKIIEKLKDRYKGGGAKTAPELFEEYENIQYTGSISALFTQLRRIFSEFKDKGITLPIFFMNLKVKKVLPKEFADVCKSYEIQCLGRPESEHMSDTIFENELLKVERENAKNKLAGSADGSVSLASTLGDGNKPSNDISECVDDHRNSNTTNGSGSSLRCSFLDNVFQDDVNESSDDDIDEDQTIQEEDDVQSISCQLRTRLADLKTVKLFQTQYLKEKLELFGMSDCKPALTPIARGTDPYSESSSDVDYPYRQAIGALLYLSCRTRPDISYSVSLLSRFIEKPTLIHVKMVKHLWRYLKGTIDYGITLGGDVSKITAFSDSDLAGEIQCKSTTGCSRADPLPGKKIQLQPEWSKEENYQIISSSTPSSSSSATATAATTTAMSPSPTPSSSFNIITIEVSTIFCTKIFSFSVRNRK